MGKIIGVLLLVVALLCSPPALFAYDEAPPDEAGGGIFWEFWHALNSFLDPVRRFIQDILCQLRVATFNVLGSFFCVECRLEAGGEGTGEIMACKDIPDCECDLCPDFLDEYKFYVADAIIWVTGAGNVLANLIPFSLWAELYTIYLELAAFIWCFRLLSKLGLMFFGFLT